MVSFGSSGRSFLQPLEFLRCAPAEAFRLSLISEKQLNAIALAGVGNRGDILEKRGEREWTR
jgi:hypothetical protein